MPVPMPEALVIGEWGVCLRDLPGCPQVDATGFDLLDAIAAAGAIGASLLQLPTVLLASATLDPIELARVRRVAEANGVRLSVALPAAHPDRRKELWGTDAADVRHPFAQLAAARRLGAVSLHITVGTDADRFRVAPTWADQLERTVPVLRELRDAAAEIPLVLKTHEEMTTFEAVRLCESVPGLLLGFSPVNVVARLEDPLRAAARVAALTHTVYIDDCAVRRGPDGLVRVMRAIGHGALPWDEILEILPATAPRIIDLHRAELRMPLYEPEWLAHENEVGVDELAVLLSRVESGGLAPDPLALRLTAAHRARESAAR